MTIISFGSINMDLVARTPHLPAPGETILGHSFATVPGGKGANQAVASARLGGATLMIGRVGADNFGPALLAHLQAENVDTSLVATDADDSSGVALIAVDDVAENTIIVISGANARVDHADVSRLEAALDEARILLLQLEVPLPAIVAAAERAHARGVTVILDPAPAQVLPDELYPLLDIITPNEGEAGQLVGFAVTDATSAVRAAAVLRQRGVQQVIIKMGSRGAFYADGQVEQLLPALPVTAVDTVAAGDAFNGGLAAALHRGKPMPEALRWGLTAGALAVTKAGAQDAMPTLAELQARL